MGRRKAAGAAIFALSIAGFVAYAYLLMLSEWSPVVLQLSVLMIVGGILGVVSWIGYTMATTRPSSASVHFDINAAPWALQQGQAAGDPAGGDGEGRVGGGAAGGVDPPREPAGPPPREPAGGRRSG